MLDDDWMKLALEDAQRAADCGNTFVGAVVVNHDKLLGRGGNAVTSLKNPLKHAETSAIEDAIARFGVAALEGATLYTTMEPCPLCAWAIQSVKIARVVLGARFADLDRTDLGSYTFEKLMMMTGRRVALQTGTRAEECIIRRRAWMKDTGRIT